MYVEDFSERLSKLRNQKGVSARDMSLSIGQRCNGFITVRFPLFRKVTTM